YYGNDHELEFDLLVAPHADAKQIRLAFSGADEMHLAENGEIAFSAEGQEVHLRKPVIYQERDGVRTDVAGKYVRLGDREVGLELAAYDSNLALIVDPKLAFGSSDFNDILTGVETDSAGTTYVLGITDAVNSFEPAPTQVEGSIGPLS